MSKIRNLPENTVPAGDDLLYSVDVSEGSNAGKKVKVSSLKAPLAQTASEVPYQRDDLDKKDISATSDDVGSALSNLDDAKLSRTGSQAMTGNLNVGGNNVTNVGTVDGRDVSVDGANLDAHLNIGLDKHTGSQITYERLDVDKKSIQTGSDSVEEALTDLDDRKLALSGAQPMTGNLSLGGNNITNVNLIDGRDVSVDGAKLDTVELNASADQTAAEVPYDNTGTPFTINNVQGALTQVANVISKPNVVRVSKNPGVGEFSSIKDAVDSITTAGQNNPIVVKVGPGVFTESTIQMKPYIAIIGAHDDSTIVVANDTSQSVFLGSPNSELKFMTIRGSTGIGAAAIYYQNNTASLSAFSIVSCEFGSSDILVKAEGGSGSSTIRIEGCKISEGANFSIAIRLTRTGVGSVIGFVGTFIYQKVSSPFPQSLFQVDNGARLVIDTSLIELNSAGTDGFRISNGAILDVIYCAISGVGRGLYVPNVGAGPILNISSLVLRNNVQDIVIENPDTTGNIAGIANSNKVSIVSDVDLTLVYKDIENGGLSVTGAFRTGRQHSTLTDVLDLIENAPTMGLLEGGELSIASGLTIDIAEGFGYIMKGVHPNHELERISWSAQSLVVGANLDLYIYFNTLGNLTSSANLPNTKGNILLGRVVSGDTSIRFIEEIPMDAHHYGNLTDLAFREAFGPIYASGSIVSENPTTAFKLDITAGVYFLSGIRIAPAARIAFTFNQLHRDGVGGYTQTSTDLVNSTSYDNGSGTLQPLSAGFYAKHVLYIAGTGASTRYYLVISQNQYASLAEAETAAEPIPPAYLRAASTTIAATVIQQGASDIVEILDLRPALGFKATSVSASSDHGSLSGLADDDHLQYLLVDGSRPMSSSLDMGANNITNVGTVDGVDVSAHKNRHLPNGSDPLDTAAPTTNLSGAINNTAGIANSFSRSDHTHAINNVTTSVAGLMSSADKTKLNGIEANAKDDQIASEVPYSNTTSGLAATQVQAAIDEVEGRVDTAESNIASNSASISNLQTNKQNISEKGQANGYASLDGAGKIPLTQLPAKLMEFEGNWDAGLNSPVLANTDTNKQGTVYRVSAPGTVDFGGGPITFDTGDWVYNTGVVWQRGDNVDQVATVFGRIGDITAQSGDYNAAQINYTPATLTDWNSDVDPGQTKDALDQLASRTTSTEDTLTSHLDQGSSRHDADQIDYERTDVSKISIQAASDNVESALSDLDDFKLALSGIQAMTGNLDMGANSITNVNLVDGVDVSLHGSRHNPDGADPLTVASPVTLSDSTNSAGTANSIVRSDHVHAHGNRGGGTLHATATQSVNGFFSSVDKTKLDNLDVGHLSYSSSSLQSTNSTTFVNVVVDTNRESFSNSNLTKVNTTDFRTDFNGQVEITYSVSAYAGANDRAVVFGIQRNTTDLVWTARKEVPRSGVDGARTVTATFVLDCAIDDIFRLRWRAPNGDTQSIDPNLAHMAVKVYRRS